MAIYTRWGVRVTLTAAELRTLFSEYVDGRITGKVVETVPPPPVKPRKKSKVYEPMFVWHAKATYAEDAKREDEMFGRAA